MRAGKTLGTKKSFKNKKRNPGKKKRNPGKKIPRVRKRVLGMKKELQGQKRVPGIKEKIWRWKRVFLKMQNSRTGGVG
ncbi:MAG: hypothetical protein HFI01_16775 [Lachnospiraceae bacterium]|nr:hypothetical protein [Lachnospiraceae bacterium]